MSFVEDVKKAVAVRVTEKLVTPNQFVKLPSYAGDSKTDPAKFITWSNGGSVNAMLDTIQSQGNRIEKVFADYADLVPAIQVQYPNTTIGLVEVPHRAADPAIRYLFADEIEKLASGDPVPLARRNPTAFIFGLWDSRKTLVKLQRAITSSITIRNAFSQPTATSLSTPFTDEYRADLTEALQELKMKPSEVGIDQVPDFKEKGTLDVSGATIERVVTFSKAVLDPYKSNAALSDYLLGLSLLALLTPIPLELRSGTTLVRESRKIEVYADLKPTQVVEEAGLFDAVLTFARVSAKRFGIGKAETLVVDTKKIIENARVFKERKEGTRAKKSGSDTKKAKVGAA